MAGSQKVSGSIPLCFIDVKSDTRNGVVFLWTQRFLFVSKRLVFWYLRTQWLLFIKNTVFFHKLSGNNGNKVIPLTLAIAKTDKLTLTFNFSILVDVNSRCSN